MITALIAILWIAWLVYWFISSATAKRNRKNYNWRGEILLRLGIILVVILFLREPASKQIIRSISLRAFYSNYIMSSIGFLIFLCGFGLTIWARVALGANWGLPRTVKEKPQLVTFGPYRYVRHPIYAGMILSMLGTSIAVTILWLIPFIVISGYFMYSAHVEEKDMLQEFPKEYKEYKKKVKALIPFIL